MINIFLIFYFRLNNFETAIILMVCFAVLVAEIFNTVIEKFADFVEPNYNKEIGIIKDIAAGGVLATAILSLIVGLIIYLPYILKII